MSIGSRIKERRIALKLTQEDLAKKLNITKGAVANYENEVSVPKPDILFKVISVLSCDANYLFQDMVKQTNDNSNLTTDEVIHIHKYKQLFDDNKIIVDTLIDKIIDIQQKPTYTKQVKKSYTSVYYDFPVSAGTGEYPEVRNAIAVELEIEPPHGTNYILRIAGDSMEPKFRNGDFVYVHSTSAVDIGDIGIFAYCGSVYMKKYTKDGLKSLNPKYPLIYGEDIKTLGKVLGIVDGEII
jgi:transcriptional regulator with XRE-family HTH domain